ncbi:uncharacterized protein EDB91DRAFT_1111188 [Suillus paluster]|uniref:uncharacterized protein n=1 Tax=Suillus paluster TaxID=48578 RepID=UPI001B8678B9|nr:uncharacterized protein EDB91DRAFT_1182192 [Suillus paluster]XP_041180860.1 uncharacterized protein EDB91DRAFT_1111188 [Suillus paluster]KAG1719088.1 hypothetical protein EDB91DRAFT_1182192 [Suillus paluster]KAG1748844.1 hypothetical protein EDB91DRAFT_1111188 [Suillus paluster]
MKLTTLIHLGVFYHSVTSLGHYIPPGPLYWQGCIPSLSDIISPWYTCRESPLPCTTCLSGLGVLYAPFNALALRSAPLESKYVL